MTRFKKSLVAFAGILAFVGLVTLLIPLPTQGQKGAPTPLPPPLNVNVVNTPLPVAGTVSVEGVVPTYPAVPPGAFSVVTSEMLVSGPDPEGTSYAITGFTMTNANTFSVRGNLIGVWGSTSDCIDFPVGDGVQTFGPEVMVPAGETVHLSFSQPFVLPAKPGATACLSSSRGHPTGTIYTVVGYRF